MYQIRRFNWPGFVNKDDDMFDDLVDAEIEATVRSIPDSFYGVWEEEKLLVIAYAGELFTK